MCLFPRRRLRSDADRRDANISPRVNELPEATNYILCDWELVQMEEGTMRHFVIVISVNK